MYDYRILWLARLLHNFDKLWKIQRWMCRSYFSAKSSFFFNSSTYLKLGVCFFSHFSWYRSKYTFLQTNTGKIFSFIPFTYQTPNNMNFKTNMTSCWEMIYFHPIFFKEGSGVVLLARLTTCHLLHRLLLAT